MGRIFLTTSSFVIFLFFFFFSFFFEIFYSFFFFEVTSVGETLITGKFPKPNPPVTIFLPVTVGGHGPCIPDVGACDLSGCGVFESSLTGQFDHVSETSSLQIFHRVYDNNFIFYFYFLSLIIGNITKCNCPSSFYNIYKSCCIWYSDQEKNDYYVDYWRCTSGLFDTSKEISRLVQHQSNTFPILFHEIYLQEKKNLNITRLYPNFHPKGLICVTK